MEAEGGRSPIVPMQQIPQLMFPTPPPLPTLSSPSSHHTSITSFPILALTILGILTTSVLLLTYYIFVIRCCLNWHNSDMTGIIARRRRGASNLPVPMYALYNEARGLELSAIQALPTFRYRKVSDINGAMKNNPAFAPLNECAVCLSEFQEEEKIRLLPDCLHVFHVDCIDTWLQANANCPLCRAAITSSSCHCQFPLDQLLGPEEVVIQMISDTEESTQQQEANMVAADSAGTDQEVSKKRKNKSWHITSKGDECIAVRRISRDVLPMRRSFSMDSLGDGEFHLQVQNILQKTHLYGNDNDSNGGGGGCM